MACFTPSTESFTTPTENIAGVPDFGWRVNLDYRCDEKCRPFSLPRLRQIPPFIGLGFRYMKQWFRWKREGAKPFIDNLNPIKHKPIYGCPIGGLGCGTIGRGYRGEFCRFQMVPGRYEYKVIQANQFIICIRKGGQTVYQKVLTGKKGKHLTSWEWCEHLNSSTYHALYPRSWTIYDIPEHKVRLICRQISPIIPHDYKDSSLPTAVFVWSVENMGSEDIEVSVTFTFKNGCGTKEDAAGGAWTRPFLTEEDNIKTTGVMICQTVNDMKCTYGVAGRGKEGVVVSYQTCFDPKGSGLEVWDSLRERGQLSSTAITTPSKKTSKGQEIATAVCIQTKVTPGNKSELEFCLSWDMPIVQFRSKEYSYARRYTRWFGTEGNACPKLCSYALENYSMWEEKIEAWQAPVLQAVKLPAWYKSALFNELYYISDGGTIWLDMGENNNIMKHSNSSQEIPSIVQEYGRFAYLEGHEYRMYNTYDVHHYASFALIKHWPFLQLSLQYDFAETIMLEDRNTIYYCMDGQRGIRKPMNSVPHDIGDPEDEPWVKINSYIIHPTYDWKDLNIKFVMQTYRDYITTDNKQYLEDMYPQSRAVMNKAIEWDTDNDGIIENSGFADQTFDAWVMTGASAYCGSMWLAALKMMIKMAMIIEKEEDAVKYTEILERGKVSFEKKLWNGKYYNFDSSTGRSRDSIMAGQLAGHWFLKTTDLQDDTIFPPEHVHSVLRTVFKNNVMKFDNGNMGAINGMRPDGSQDITSCQAEEFWVGITYSVAADMIQEGMIQEGFQTAWGAYHVCWERFGLAFQTPEAYMSDGRYRSLGYMRPLAIWAMQLAVEKFQPHLLQNP